MAETRLGAACGAAHDRKIITSLVYLSVAALNVWSMSMPFTMLVDVRMTHLRILAPLETLEFLQTLAQQQDVVSLFKVTTKK
jgi:hypothetical protein